jgi:hypothetical protein
MYKKNSIFETLLPSIILVYDDFSVRDHVYGYYTVYWFAPMSHLAFSIFPIRILKKQVSFESVFRAHLNYLSQNDETLKVAA